MYTRIFTSILDSSLNENSFPVEARWLFLVMLIIADEDRTGVVDMPVSRLAARAGLSVEETEKGLESLSQPDPDSRSEAEEGRRIAPLQEGKIRGWRIVNWPEYREIANEEQRRAQVRKAVAKHRQREKVINSNTQEITKGLPVINSNTPEASATANSSPSQNHTGDRGDTGERGAVETVENAGSAPLEATPTGLKKMPGMTKAEFASRKERLKEQARILGGGDRKLRA